MNEAERLPCVSQWWPGWVDSKPQRKFSGAALGFRSDAFARGFEVMGVEFDTGEGGELLAVGSYGGGADAEEWIEQARFGALAMQANALLDKCDRKGGGMRPILVAGVDGFIGDEPVVSAAA